jgi:bacteriocin-like protein
MHSDAGSSAAYRQENVAMDKGSEFRNLTDEELNAVTGGADESWWSGTDEVAEFKQLALELARCCGVLGPTFRWDNWTGMAHSALQVRGDLFWMRGEGMTNLEHFDWEIRELTNEELIFVTGGADSSNNNKLPIAQARTTVKDAHDRYANVEIVYLR